MVDLRPPLPAMRPGEWYRAADGLYYCWPDPTPHDEVPLGGDLPGVEPSTVAPTPLPFAASTPKGWSCRHPIATLMLALTAALVIAAVLDSVRDDGRESPMRYDRCELVQQGLADTAAVILGVGSNGDVRRGAPDRIARAIGAFSAARGSLDRDVAVAAGRMESALRELGHGIAVGEDMRAEVGLLPTEAAVRACGLSQQAPQ